jgi:hypothetical protein
MNVKLKVDRSLQTSTVYSNYVVVQSGGVDLRLIFCEVRHPLTEEEAALVGRAGYLAVASKVEILIPLELARGLTNALQAQLKFAKQGNTPEGCLTDTEKERVN